LHISVYLRGILLHYFIQKKSAAEAHRILVQTYGDNALSDTTCRDWFRRFKNNDFQLEDKERSDAPKKFQDKELEQLLDEDPSQTQSELGKILQVDKSTVSKRLKGLGMIQKQGHWVPYELLLLLHGKINTRRPKATAETTATTLSNNVAGDIIAYRVQFTNGPCMEDDSSLAAFTHSSSNGYTIINPVRYYDVDDGLPPTMPPE
ncbi:MOS1T transposase, partial [Pseudoatta argentina]